MKICVLTVCLFFIHLSMGNADSHIAYRHAYYLFIVGPSEGCENCYIPLLITQAGLDEINNDKPLSHSVLITTYERDSIWDVKNPSLTIQAKDVKKAERIITISGKAYRYQEITTTEAIRLLENPAGKIPISRPASNPILVNSEILKTIVADLKTTK